MDRLLFFIQEGLRALRRNAAPSVAAVVTIVVTVLLLGVLIPVLQTTEGKAQEVRSKIQLKVFLYDDATQGEITALQKRIDGVPHVDSLQFVSKTEALQILKKRLKDPNVLKELNSNPLPASFNIKPDDPANLDSIHSALTPPNAAGKATPISPIVQEVKDSREEASKITAVTGALKIVLTIITALLVIASLMLVGNTIRLSIYSRRREVEVMRLVGATKWFIRWPFMVEGVIVGAAGGLVAVIILWIGKVTVVDPLSDRFALVAAQNTINFLPLIGVLLLSAMAVSAMGSGVTLRRFLRV
ncbi:MAG: cell division transport system permease protein [Solirubrobacterales bacterium]|jgi:cell division transport system permease protein|nr:cell division transport system permease protein [Solirubrobacterales bacterium]MDX6651997.1 cell division transport system permease protein [Solirubrobacterales bacterium]MDX6662485.1 cell division transport system permease protein [Solirubrobacterales bacterium]